MVQLFEYEKHDNGRQSSKGNQLKFYRDGMWYKADYLGYEGLAEYVISKLLKKSNLDPKEYVDYEIEQIEYNGNIYNACKSRDFTEGWNLITLERLFKNMYGNGLNNMIYSVRDKEERLKILVEQTERVTGIKEFGIYMNKMLTIDSLFLNEDRHTHNIAVLVNDKNEFRVAPVFDNGADNVDGLHNTDSSALGTIREEAAQALVALGYSQTESYKAVRSVEAADDVETVLKRALSIMSKF